ncbi:MAG: biotin/lipoate A/B protein ligase family protein [archaeon]
MPDEWRLIELEIHSASENMALDEACLDEIASGNSPPTIRFYRWKPSAVSIGYFQSIESEVNLDECAKNGIDVVRRQTGGGAVFHDYENEITYSIIAPEKMFPKGITESYREICGFIVSGLEILGLHAEFKPINDVLVNGKKVSGNAQTRRKGVLLQHGTILYGLDLDRMFSVLRVGSEKISDKAIQSVRDRVTSIRDECNSSYGECLSAIESSFIEGKTHYFSPWTSAELLRAKELAEKKYSAREWNYLR